MRTQIRPLGWTKLIYFVEFLCYRYAFLSIKLKSNVLKVMPEAWFKFFRNMHRFFMQSVITVRLISSPCPRKISTRWSMDHRRRSKSYIRRLKLINFKSTHLHYRILKIWMTQNLFSNSAKLRVQKNYSIYSKINLHVTCFLNTV